ncbi:GGDEF domain-containing protein [Chitinibacter fontanus]|uniref:diguanylate cyclase n=1 Tax=Chitinibacter fontanus TaxID=1737446 RepID=A0A7D5ZBQ9_9NEIS|nr:sensor domain-containing diguanylate cyclase [Chitinibacter fontanus]QLI80966.1 GGDEF domain-containing protein [Chitinibacter fontanus]
MQVAPEILSALFDISPSGIAIADEQGRYLQVNEAYCRLFGYSQNELIGQTFGLILLDSDKELEPEILALALNQDQSAPSEWQVKHRDGRVLFVHSAFKTFHAPDGSARILTILSDVTTLVATLRNMQDHELLLRKANENLEEIVSNRTMMLEHANKELARLATQDPLTGLYNRRAFETEAAKAIYTADRHQRPCSVLFLDIDHFKSINDQFGHAIGDEVLQKTAEKIITLLRCSDLVARWGGEEFVLLLPDTPLEQALVVGEKILDAIRSLQLFNTQIQITISGGLVERQLNTPLEHTLQQADMLLYQAKQSGRNRLASAPALPQHVDSLLVAYPNACVSQ